MAHANARTNLFARRLIVERVAAGWPAAHVAEQLGVSRATVHKWLRRHAEAGDAGLVDRSSRPQRMPARTSKRVEQRVLAARRRRKRGAVVLAAELGLNPSTVGRILARHGVAHLAAIDPITGEQVRSSRRSSNRYEHSTPGAMIHVDVKKLGRIPAGGGWRAARARARCSANRQRRQDGYDFVHTAIDDHTRLAYSEIHPDEKDATCAGFLHRALAWFAAHGIHVRRCSPTTHWSIAAAPTGAGSARPGSSNAASPNPAAPGPTARPNGSTAPCSPSGPTPAPGPATPRDDAALTDS